MIYTGADSFIDIGRKWWHVRCRCTSHIFWSAYLSVSMSKPFWGTDCREACTPWAIHLVRAWSLHEKYYMTKKKIIVYERRYGSSSSMHLFHKINSHKISFIHSARTVRTYDDMYVPLTSNVRRYQSSVRLSVCFHFRRHDPIRYNLAHMWCCIFLVPL